MALPTSGHRTSSALTGLLLLGGLLPLASAQPDNQPKPRNPWREPAPINPFTEPQPMSPYFRRLYAESHERGSARPKPPHLFLRPIVHEGRLAFKAHEGGVGSLTFSPDGKILATTRRSYEDGTVKLWDAKRDVLLASVKAHKRGVAALLFAPDGKSFATDGLDGMIRVWEVPSADQKEIRKLAEYPNKEWGAFAFHPDGRLLGTRRDGKGVKVAELSTGKGLFHWPDVPDKVGLRHFTVQRDTAYLVAGSGAPEPRAQLQFVTWESKTGEQAVHEIPPREGEFYLSAWTTVAVSPDRRYVAIGLGDNVQAYIDSYPIPRGGWDQLGLAMADAGHVRVWDVSAKKEKMMVRGHNGPVVQLAFSPDGKYLASLDDLGFVRVWEPAIGRSVLGRMVDAPASVVAFSPDGKTIVTGREDGHVRFWELSK